MSNLVQFPDRRRAMSEASIWVVSIEEGLSEVERHKLEEWLEADPENPKALIRLAEVSEAFDVLSELAEIFPIDRYRERRSKRRFWSVASVAVSVAGIAILGAWILPRVPASTSIPDTISVSLPEWRGADIVPPDTIVPSKASYRTVIGEQLSARLPDGSVVTLNTDTELDIGYTESERLVTIAHGEASFNVVADASRPFRVRASTRVVQAVGTTFNVRLNSNSRVEVTVSEGSVWVIPAASLQAPAASDISASGLVRPSEPIGEEMTVTAGEVAVINGSEAAVKPIDPLEIEAKLAWQRGMLVFRGSPLEEVLADVSRYTTIKLRIADESIRRKRVGGYFRAGDIDALLLALRESFDIEPERSGEEIVLRARR